MNWLREEDFVLYEGEKFRVEFYFTAKGELPGKEYFDTSDRQVQVKLLALVKYMAEEGRLFDEEKFRLVDMKEKIHEFKPMAERFFNFFTQGKKIIITNAYRKKGQKVDQKELLTAIRLKKDYEFRVKEEVYYGAH
jgi:hypothetical protein